MRSAPTTPTRRLSCPHPRGACPLRASTGHLVFFLFILGLASALLTSSTEAKSRHEGVAIVPGGTIVPTSDIPDPANCSVIPCDVIGGIVLAPDVPGAAPASIVEVTVRDNAGNPMVGVVVSCDILAPAGLCPTAVRIGTTDAAGQATLRLYGGGCQAEMSAGVVRANGIAIRRYEDVKSPDFDGAGSDLQVNLADLLAFSAEFLGQSPAGCHDYDNSGGTTLSDLVIFSPLFAASNHCP